MKPITYNADLLTTVLGIVALIATALGSADVIPVETALLIDGIVTQIVAYFTQKKN